MKLDLGGLEVIRDPTPDQAAHHLRFMPAESPFIVLSRYDDEFIQAIIEDGKYRVEYKENETQWFAKVEYEKARKWFWCFKDESCELAEAVNWKRLIALNTPWHASVVIALTVLIVAGAAIGVCIEIGLL